MNKIFKAGITSESITRKKGYDIFIHNKTNREQNCIDSNLSQNLVSINNPAQLGEPYTKSINLILRW